MRRKAASCEAQRGSAEPYSAAPPSEKGGAVRKSFHFLLLLKTLDLAALIFDFLLLRL